MQHRPGLQMETGTERVLEKAAGVSDLRLRTLSHTDTIDLCGHGDRGYLNLLNYTFEKSRIR